VECDAATWEGAKLEELSDGDSENLCARIFRKELEGAPLLSNKSKWGVFRIVHNDRWVADRVVLLGDAMHTVHFSIGSGTRSALEDATVLFHSLVEAPTLNEGLLAYERERRAQLAPLLGVARRSADWYEKMHEKMGMAPVAFAYDYLMRGGELTVERLMERAPRFMQYYLAYAHRPM
jgi:2-polyprenyl-6-methoxyphenol hydroxylase-like FAD-dependent oxidoreductase